MKADAIASLILALRCTAEKLQKGATYHWGHMGACNCGNLAQELVEVSKAEIHAWALESREGDWSEQTAEYCPTSQLPLDLLIRKMLEKGLQLENLKHLEKLSDPWVLAQLPQGDRELHYHRKADVIRYLNAWANALEQKWAEKTPLPPFFGQKERLTY